jgi:hypothetical protein
MSYYHAYPGYADYGNHGDDGYDEYEPYSDYTEPDHWEPEPTLSEPDYHNYAHVTDPTEHNHNANCEYDADDANLRANETYQPQWSEYKGEIEAHELKELEHGEDKIDEYERGRYEPQGLDHGGNGAQELGELGYEEEAAYGDGDELGELEREYERGIYEPFGLEYEGYEHEELVHEPKRGTEASYAQHAQRPTTRDANP